jgi:hypothetical protein
VTQKAQESPLPKDKRTEPETGHERKKPRRRKGPYSRMGNWEYKLKNFN